MISMLLFSQHVKQKRVLRYSNKLQSWSRSSQGIFEKMPTRACKNALFYNLVKIMADKSTKTKIKMRGYHAVLHDKFCDPRVYYRLTRVLSSNSAIKSMEYSVSRHWIPRTRTFNLISDAMYKVDKENRGDMSLEEYRLHLLDPVTK